MLAAYIFGGPGASPLCVALTLRSLRRCLPATTAVRVLQKSAAIASNAWTKDASVLIMPGGHDLGYVSTLQSSPGAAMIRSYVEGGGSYLGICAGAYFGSGRTVFERDDPTMSVVGNRPLGFFRGDAVGSTAPRRFEYKSEEGASGIDITLSSHFVKRCKDSGERMPDEEPLRVPGYEVELQVYVNGGCCFEPRAVDLDRIGVGCPAEPFPNNCEVLAWYSDDQRLRNNAEGKAAIVSCEVGNGRAVLSGVHPEFTADDARNAAAGCNCEGAVLQDRDDLFRLALFRSLLREAGVEVLDVTESLPRKRFLHDGAN